jgi:D-alanine-D-alanine ligase
LKDIKFSYVKKQLGLPMFIKPANGGSSIGSNKVDNEEQFKFATKEAFKYDNRIIIERFIKGREVECSVLGNDNPKASLIGEVVSGEKFYSYDDKYVKADGAQLIAPAKLTQSQVKKLQATALKAYKALECRGFSRVDMFLTPDNEVYLNEINTIPGFTNISMYPRL